MQPVHVYTAENNVFWIKTYQWIEALSTVVSTSHIEHNSNEIVVVVGAVQTASLLYVYECSVYINQQQYVVVVVVQQYM